MSPFPRPTGKAPRCIIVIAIASSLVIATILAGCGSQGGQAMVLAPALAQVLAPAIPAAEPVLIFAGQVLRYSDVAAIKTILKTLGLGYLTANSNQLGANTSAIVEVVSETDS